MSVVVALILMSCGSETVQVVPPRAPTVGDCDPESTEDEPCGSETGTCTLGSRSRTCVADGSWGPWSACEGSQAPAPEVCGDGLDQDCDGVADEWCSCEPIGPGDPFQIDVEEGLVALAAAPDRCAIYGLTFFPAEFLVFDAGLHQVIERIPLSGPAIGLDVSPSGQHITVLYDTEAASVDPETWTLTPLPVSQPPLQLQRLDDGTGMYIDGSRQFWRMESDGSDLGLPHLGKADAFWLTQNGERVFLEHPNGGVLLRDAMLPNHVGAMYPRDPVESDELWASSHHPFLYVQGHQVDLDRLFFVRGRLGEESLTESPDGGLVVGERHVFDAVTLAPVHEWSSTPIHAVFPVHGEEVWVYDLETYAIQVHPRESVQGDAELGERHRAPRTLDSYTIGQLIHHPSAPVLYGLDREQHVVVRIDAGTLELVDEIRVGSDPFAMMLGEDALYVGHDNTAGLAQIDLATSQFVDLLPVSWWPTMSVVMPGDVLIAGRSSGSRFLLAYDIAALPTVANANDAVLFDHVVSHGGVFPEGYGQPGVEDPGLVQAGGQLFAGHASNGSLLVTELTIDGAQLVEGPTVQVASEQSALLAMPDGSGVFAGDEGVRLNAQLEAAYALGAPAVAVSPDARWVTTAEHVFLASVGERVATLPSTTTVQAVSPDSATLFVLGEDRIQRVDLTGM